jgi:hypothetical protein
MDPVRACLTAKAGSNGLLDRFFLPRGHPYGMRVGNYSGSKEMIVHQCYSLIVQEIQFKAPPNFVISLESTFLI